MFADNNTIDEPGNITLPATRKWGNTTPLNKVEAIALAQAYSGSFIDAKWCACCSGHPEPTLVV